MRISIIVLLALAACTSHEVRCDRHLQRINPVTGPGAGAPVAVAPPAVAPLGAP